MNAVIQHYKTSLSKILCLDNSFWIILKWRRTENDKKNKKRTWRNW
ncbi:hypothetical protein [Spiroplasma endosymbiont of Clivina fossor]